jgi:hypothetical protein
MPVPPQNDRPHADAALPTSLAGAARQGAHFSDFADIFARYDVTAISPRAIDRLAERLRAAGFQDTRFLSDLEAHGATFQRSVGRADPASGADSLFDPDAPRDLIGEIRGWIGMARRFGHTTRQARRLLGQLERIEALGRPETLPEPLSPSVGAPGQTPL